MMITYVTQNACARTPVSSSVYVIDTEIKVTEKKHSESVTTKSSKNDANSDVSQQELQELQQECISEDEWARRVQIHKEAFEGGLAKRREAKGGNHTTSLSELKYKSLVLQLYEWETSSSAERTRRRQDHGTIVYKNSRKYCVVEVGAWAGWC